MNEKGWMDEAACKLWVNSIWLHRTRGLVKEKSPIKATNTDVTVIPGGLTGILQPLDVSINKPFKDGLRKRWVHWMATDQYDF